MMDNDLISRSVAVGILRAKADTAVCTDWHMLYLNAARIIEKLPAVDAEVVRHGRWVPFGHDDSDEGLYKCSVCAKKQYNGFGDIKEYLKYCPECGAKMDGDVSAAD